jgi:hypothetical protein
MCIAPRAGFCHQPPVCIGAAVFERAVQLWLGVQCGNRFFNLCRRVTQKGCDDFLRHLERHIASTVRRPQDAYRKR